MRWISVLTNVADQLYYPCEHIAWAADAELIKAKSDKWWLFSTVLWGSSLLLGILRSEIICPLTSHQINGYNGLQK